MYPDKLTLENLVPSEDDRIVLKSFTKQQRNVLYHTFERLRLTASDENMRRIAEIAWDELRKHTLNGDVNKCGFDITQEEKNLKNNPIISSRKKS